MLAAAPLVAELLASAPRLKILATSRATLHLSGESELVVPPLSQFEAVQLFVERARSVKRNFSFNDENASSIVEICVRLDGLPLAIELAAARCRALRPEAILARLGQRLELLTGGPRDLPARQQTLRDTIDWSYRLLRPEEQRLLAHLGVFVGGCTIEAVAATCRIEAPGGALDALDSLVAKSLLRQEDGVAGEPRFALFETIREFALERLAADGEREQVRQRHAVYFLELAEASAAGLVGSEQRELLELLDGELINLRAALSWSVEAGAADLGLRISVALERFWEARGHAAEIRRWLESALRGAGSVSRRVRARSLLLAARFDAALSDYAQAAAGFEEPLALFREAGDREGMAQTLASFGWTTMMLGDFPRGRALCEEALEVAREVGHAPTISRALNNLAADLLDESLSIERRLEGPRRAVALCNLGLSRLRGGDPLRARDALEEALVLARELGDSWQLASILDFLGWTELAEHRHVEAASYFEESLVRHRELGDRRYAADCLQGSRPSASRAAAMPHVPRGSSVRRRRSSARSGCLCPRPTARGTRPTSMQPARFCRPIRFAQSGGRARH